MNDITSPSLWLAPLFAWLAALLSACGGGGQAIGARHGGTRWTWGLPGDGQPGNGSKASATAPMSIAG